MLETPGNISTAPAGVFRPTEGHPQRPGLRSAGIKQKFTHLDRIPKCLEPPRTIFTVNHRVQIYQRHSQASLPKFEFYGWK